MGKAVRRALVTALGMLAAAASANAHGVLTEVRPADGAALTTPPQEIALRFDEPHRVTMLSLVTADGVLIALEVDRSPADSVSTTAPELPPGAYQLRWRALSPDGHAVGGETTFGIEPGR